MNAEAKVKSQIENGNLTLRTLKEVKKGVFTPLSFTDYTLLWGDKATEKLAEDVKENLRSNNYVMIMPKKGAFIYMTIEEFNAKYNKK